MGQDCASPSPGGSRFSRRQGPCLDVNANNWARLSSGVQDNVLDTVHLSRSAFSHEGGDTVRQQVTCGMREEAKMDEIHNTTFPEGGRASRTKRS